jgi:hypothetical protein
LLNRDLDYALPLYPQPEILKTQVTKVRATTASSTEFRNDLEPSGALSLFQKVRPFLHYLDSRFQVQRVIVGGTPQRCAAREQAAIRGD